MHTRLEPCKKNCTNSKEIMYAWELVPRLEGVNMIGSKQFYRNIIDENGNITRDKAILVAKEYTKVEGVDFEETFAPVN